MTSNTIFSQKEVEYIKSQRLARIATAAPSVASSKEELQQGQEYTSIQPDVVPVGFDFDGDYFYVGGMNILKSTKYKNVLKNNKVAIVIDDLKSIDPWDPRGIKVYGTADVVTRQGGYMEGTGHPNPSYIRVKPDKKWSWGIEEPVFVEGRFNVKRAKRD
jgi:pyridoxamine 5'-phosphate oxidase family protein